MGLFGKKDKPKERNEISNRELKEILTNNALATLKQDEHYDNLADTSVEFGYLFDIDDHGLEGLFKIITDKGSYYFAVQKKSLITLNFNEDLFQSTTKTFLELHS